MRDSCGDTVRGFCPFSWDQLLSVFLFLISAAFLGQPAIGFYHNSVQSVHQSNHCICAINVIKGELTALWPDVKFSWHDTIPSMFEAYDKNECQAICLGKNVLMNNVVSMEGVCKRNLMLSPNALVYDNQMALPINREIAAGLSHYMRKGQELGITFESVSESHKPTPPCNFHFDANLDKDGTLYALKPSNMVFPIMVFASCVVVSIFLKIFWNSKRVIVSHTSRRFGQSVSKSNDKLEESLSSAKHSRPRLRKNASATESGDKEQWRENFETHHAVASEDRLMVVAGDGCAGKTHGDASTTSEVHAFMVGAKLVLAESGLVDMVRDVKRTQNELQSLVDKQRAMFCSMEVQSKTIAEH